MNNAAVDKATDAIVEIPVPAAWKKLKDDKPTASREPAYVKDVMRPVLAQKGDYPARVRVLPRRHHARRHFQI